MRLIRTAMIVALAACLAPVEAQQDDTFRLEFERMMSSPLYQQARNAGGQISKVRDADPAKLYPDLASLFKASDLVALVHINRNACKLSPSGTEPITAYNASVIFAYKGSSGGTLEKPPLVWFSIPTGMVSFDAKTVAAAAVRNFQTLANGKRYLVFLRAARGDERQLTPTFRLAGDGVQGAFEVLDERIIPNFHGDALWRKYLRAPAATLLADVEPLTAEASYAAAAGRPHVVTPTPDIENYRDITVAQIEAADLHLPSYMSTIWLLRKYGNERLATHQQLKVTWDSLPGVSGPNGGAVPCHTVENLPISPDFVIVERKHGIEGAPGFVGDFTGYYKLIRIGITSSSEVRSLNIVYDPRVTVIEGSCLVTPKVTFDMVLPDDPEIKAVVFFRLAIRPVARDASLEKIGTLAIPAH